MKTIIKAMIEGVFDIIKLIILLYAVYSFIDTGLLNEVISYFK